MTDASSRPPGAMPTLEEVARVARVSRATVSRVVNGSPRVSPEAHDAVTRAVAELGYIPNRAARSLVTRRTGSIAVVVPEAGSRIFAQPFFASVLKGVSSRLVDSDLQLVLLLAPDEGDNDRLVRYLKGGHVDGALVVSHHESDNLVDELLTSPLPVVFGGRPLLHTPGVSASYVDVDNVGGARAATQHLIRSGHRRVGTVTGPRDMPAGVDRHAGWREALEEAGLPADAATEGDFTADGGALAMRDLLTRHPDTDAVFVASDLMAAAALQVLQSHGRRVPEDVAVVGFDDSELGRTTSPPLTTIRQPTEELGRGMVDLLIAQLAGDPLPDEPLMLETQLIIRQSG